MPTSLALAEVETRLRSPCIRPSSLSGLFCMAAAMRRANSFQACLFSSRASAGRSLASLMSGCKDRPPVGVKRVIEREVGVGSESGRDNLSTYTNMYVAWTEVEESLVGGERWLSTEGYHEGR